MKLLVDNNGFSNDQIDAIFIAVAQQFSKENTAKISGIKEVKNKLLIPNS